MILREESPEVLYCDDGIVGFDHTMIESLKVRAAENARKRCRICAHPNPQEARHDMLIVHHRDCFIRPHRHRDKSETIHVVEGTAILLTYSSVGELAGSQRLGPAGSGDWFLFRTPVNVFHALAITSEWLVFHETTSGPFNRDAQEYAPWSVAPKNWSEEVALAAQLRNTATDFERAHTL
jgi:cupin fold WbuC family metalloprotein